MMIRKIFFGVLVVLGTLTQGWSGNNDPTSYSCKYSDSDDIPVSINQLYNPRGNSADGYIELYVRNGAVNLTGWKLCYATGNNTNECIVLGQNKGDVYYNGAKVGTDGTQSIAEGSFVVYDEADFGSNVFGESNGEMMLITPDNKAAHYVIDYNNNPRPEYSTGSECKTVYNDHAHGARAEGICATPDGMINTSASGDTDDWDEDCADTKGTYNSNPIPPTAEWRMDECVWNGTSGEIKDSIGSRHGTSKGLNSIVATTSDNGMLNRAGEFKGEGYNADPNNTWYPAQYYTEIADHSSLSPLSILQSAEMSLTGWFKLNNVGDTHTILHKGGTDASQEYRVFIEGGKLKFTIWNMWGSEKTTVINHNIQPNQYYFFAVMAKTDVSLLPLFPLLDTVEVDVYLKTESGTYSEKELHGGFVYNLSKNGNLYFGATKWNNTITNFLNGKMDEIKLYNHKLNLQEINRIYINESNGKNYNDTIRANVSCVSPSVSIAGALSVMEGNSGTKTISFPITITNPNATAITLTANTTDGTATAGTDYVALSNYQFTIPANTSTFSLDVTINGDTDYEPDETFTVTLSSPINATIEGEKATGTILNDDSASFDAWEPTLTRDTARLYTKVAGQGFRVVVGPKSGTFTGTICVSAQSGSNWSGAYLNNSIGTEITNELIAPNATRNTKLLIRYKKDENAPGSCGAGYGDGDDGNVSSDAFAIRPAYLSVSTPMPIVQKAGDDTNKIAINTGTAGYSQTFSNLDLSISSWLKIDGTALGSTPPTTTGLTLTGSGFSGATGNTTDAAFTFGDVGRFTVDVNDTKWASSSSDISNGDCLTTPTSFTAANTLSGGKYGCFVMLNPQSGIDLRFIPYQFNITGASLENAQGGSDPDDSFTYFSSHLDSQAATIPMTITAVNKANGTTLNYSSGLYERNISIVPSGITQSGFTETNSSISSKALGFSNGTLTLDSTSSNAYKFNFERSYNTPLAPLPINGSDINIAVTDEDDVSGTATAGGSAKFLYGKVSAPNAMIDYNSDTAQTVRAYVQVYVPDPANLPGGASGWTNAPGSSVWWINKLHEGTSDNLEDADVVVKNSGKLDNTTNLSGFTTDVLVPQMTGGLAQISIGMPSGTTNNKDQQIKLHFAVPEYLWFGSKAYSFSNNTDCTTHPCMSVDIFRTNTTNWFGSGDDMGDKAIKSVPKGKRQPKVNW